jgi:hypothetical protein
MYGYEIYLCLESNLIQLISEGPLYDGVFIVLGDEPGWDYIIS